MQELFVEGTEAVEVVWPGLFCGPWGMLRIPTTITNRSLVYFSTRLDHYERVSEGTWLSEPCLWARWEYRGQLEAGDMAHYIAPWQASSLEQSCKAINGDHFATTVAAAGGQLAQLIRTIGPRPPDSSPPNRGLLYISLAESREESGQPLTDLPLSRPEAQDLTERAGRFGQLRLRPHVRRSRAGFSAVFGRSDTEAEMEV